MLLIPELKKVVILVPRTGTGALRRAIVKRYPRAMMIYRHMEADGVPQGYEYWQKIGVMRQPIDRLWSLYKFCRDYEGQHPNPEYKAKLRASTQIPFDEWVRNNEVVFTHGWGTGYDDTEYHPLHTVRHALPENRKSQFTYLRPDLGTRIWFYEDTRALYEELDIGKFNETHNSTTADSAPKLTTATMVEVIRRFSWDCGMYRRRRDLGA